MIPATTYDVQARWRPLTDAETGLAHVLLDDAWVMLLTRRPSLESQITAGTVRVENVRRVLCDMVRRVLRNPDALVEESVDDYRYRRDPSASSGALMVTDAELADITPAATAVRSVRLVAYGDA